MKALFFVLLSGSCLAAHPIVSVEGVSQDPMTRAVTVNYELSDDEGIVTIDVLTNAGENVWASIGQENISRVSGEVGKVVGIGKHSLVWHARESWPNHEVAEGNAKIVLNAWSSDAPPDYMAVNVSDGTTMYKPAAGSFPGGVTNNLWKTDWIVLRKINAAGIPWTMGTVANQDAFYSQLKDNSTNQTVVLQQNYYIGIYEITQRQYYNITGSNPAKYQATFDKDGGRALENCSFSDFRGANYGAAPKESSFLGKLNKLSGKNFDLPSEAQWEYAARSGQPIGYWNNGVKVDATFALNANLIARNYNNHKGTSSDETVGPEGCTAVVGSYEPSLWGLYDMAGNVYERCLDIYEARHIYPNGDGTVCTTGQNRVNRGGCFTNQGAEISHGRRIGIVDRASSMIGYRIVLVL